MSGQAAMKTVREVKSDIKKVETNSQLKGSNKGGTEVGASGKHSARIIGKK